MSELIENIKTFFEVFEITNEKEEIRKYNAMQREMCARAVRSGTCKHMCPKCKWEVIDEDA
ncbi:hypothetical protein [Methanobrevibacter sp.]|uniref:hypothetical protein n=1 Tax=Methanobrevibacter sp. TaxID=66852 RepID=UPI00388F6286